MSLLVPSSTLARRLFTQFGHHPKTLKPHQSSDLAVTPTAIWAVADCTMAAHWPSSSSLFRFIVEKNKDIQGPLIPVR
jgi:hypothetical protein